jgi:hypothetical protein
MRASKTCPAVMLAKSRKQSVIGRTKILTTSTIHKNGTRYQGLFLGKTAEPFNILIVDKDTPNNQKDTAATKLNPKVVLTG